MREVRAGALLTATSLLVLLIAGLPSLAHPSSGLGLIAPDHPEVTAEAWIVYDQTYGKVLAEVDPDSRRSVASVTKILTALVVLQNVGTDDLVAITDTAASVGESEIGLVTGEAAWTVEELLAALILRSANDAAVALAEHVGGSVAGFAEMMNGEATRLGLTDSNFVNPHGLDHSDHYSSARDILRISVAAMANPAFARIAATRSFSLPPTPEGESRVAVNRNDLLATYPGTLGIKTGYTGRALQTLSAVAERDRRRIHVVVLGSQDHFADVALLFDYAFGSFGPLTLVPVTSEQRRPLAGSVAAQPGTDFEVFPDRAEEPPPDPEEAVVVDAPETEAGTVAVDPDAEAAAPPVTQRIERQVELPGIRDALTWVSRYWQGLRAGNDRG
ncbi:MAG: D-alanyl-D-alanine carboxypeptidase [Acidimicrobiia bacterium]|nr:D-alanyl-D-alanine carboxypeptidase [Acidimicrobiia bacterium]